MLQIDLKPQVFVNNRQTVLKHSRTGSSLNRAVRLSTLIKVNEENRVREKELLTFIAASHVTPEGAKHLQPQEMGAVELSEELLYVDDKEEQQSLLQAPLLRQHGHSDELRLH